VLALLTILSARGIDWLIALRSPPAITPMALFALIAASMRWSPNHWAGWTLSLHEDATNFVDDGRQVHARQAIEIAYGFLYGLHVLLLLSFASLIWPSGPWGRNPCLRIVGWRRSLAAAIPIGILVVVATLLSGQAQPRLKEISADVMAFAPPIGHGTS
jgi:hypothetical protein